MIGHNNITHNSVFLFIQRVEPLINRTICIANAKKVPPFIASECDKVNTVGLKAMLEPDWHL